MCQVAAQSDDKMAWTMSADIYFANDEWFWKAWADTISTRPGQSSVCHIAPQAAPSIVNPASLLSSEFLEQYGALVMLLERFSASPKTLSEHLFAWHPRRYEDYFHNAGLRDGPLAITAFANSPAAIREALMRAVVYLDEEAFSAIEAVRSALQGRIDKVPAICHERAATLRQRLEDVNALIAAQPAPGIDPAGGNPSSSAP
jgi:hypothetical protein